MSTFNQENAAKKVKEAIEKGDKVDGGTILENIGYSKAIAKNPKMVFQSKGFKDAIEKLGFSLEAADLTVAKILRVGKEENQLKASDQIYKRLSGYAAEKRDVNLKLPIPIYNGYSVQGYDSNEEDISTQETN